MKTSLISREGILQEGFLLIYTLSGRELFKNEVLKNKLFKQEFSKELPKREFPKKEFPKKKLPNGNLSKKDPGVAHFVTENCPRLALTDPPRALLNCVSDTIPRAFFCCPYLLMCSRGNVQLIIPRLGLERSITSGLLVYAFSQVKIRHMRNTSYTWLLL